VLVCSHIWIMLQLCVAKRRTSVSMCWVNGVRLCEWWLAFVGWWLSDVLAFARAMQEALEKRSNVGSGEDSKPPADDDWQPVQAITCCVRCDINWSVCLFVCLFQCLSFCLVLLYFTIPNSCQQQKLSTVIWLTELITGYEQINQY